MAPTYIVGDFPQPGAMPIVIDGQVVVTNTPGTPDEETGTL